MTEGHGANVPWSSPNTAVFIVTGYACWLTKKGIII